MINENYGGRSSHRRQDGAHPLFENCRHASIAGFGWINERCGDAHLQEGIFGLQQTNALRQIVTQRAARPKKKRHHQEIADAGAQAALQCRLKNFRLLSAELVGGDRAGMQQGHRVNGAGQGVAQPGGNVPQVQSGRRLQRAIVDQQDSREGKARGDGHFLTQKRGPPWPKLRRANLFNRERNLVRLDRIELSTPAWKAEVLPLNYSRGRREGASCVKGAGQACVRREPGMRRLAGR